MDLEHHDKLDAFEDGEVAAAKNGPLYLCMSSVLQKMGDLQTDPKIEQNRNTPLSSARRNTAETQRDAGREKHDECTGGPG